MKIAKLIKNLPVELKGGSPQQDVDAIVEDSRIAAPGCLFVARPGVRVDGHTFIAEAVDAGAVAVLCRDPHHVPATASALVCDDVAATMAVMAERFYGCPSRALDLVGITGTNGKTTTSHFIRQILAAVGVRCGLIGTVQVHDGAGLRPARLTTPSALELSHLLRAMVSHGCTAAAVEVSSHALDQQRVAGLHFDGAVFTNLSGDHLDYHGSMQSYAAAKAKLFELIPSDGWAVLNADDPRAPLMVTHCRGHIVSCSLRDDAAMCRTRIHRQTLETLYLSLRGPWGAFDVALPLVGSYNAANVMQAVAACHLLGLDADALREGLAACTAPPGRLERITEPDDPYTVFVDYAHTDDALEKVLRGLRPLVPASGGLRVVFGCGGDRDRTKRPRMARVAWYYGDDVIITSDNPRTEDPEAIIDEILAGVPVERRAETRCIVDRRAAIEQMIAEAESGDVIVIAGKGHEDYQIIGTERKHFDDRQVATEAHRRRRLGVAVP